MINFSKVSIFDTHCHLSDIEFSQDNIKRIISEAKENGVDFIMNVGYDKKSNEIVIDQSNSFPDLLIALGIHPNSNEDFSEQNLNWIEDRIIENKGKIVAIGEIGLDFYRCETEKDKQKFWFRKQLRLSKKYNLPVLLHIRDAFEEAYQIICEENIEKGLVHCFTGDIAIANKFLQLGFYLSFAGNITYRKKNLENKLESVIKNIPLTRILIETDSPYLSPEPFRGKKNFPKNIIHTLKRISEIKEIDIEIIWKKIFQNSLDLFEIKKKID